MIEMNKTLILDEDKNFKLYTTGKVYKRIEGLIKNKVTNEVFEGIVTLYRYWVNGQWEYDEDIYEALPYSENSRGDTDE